MSPIKQLILCGLFVVPAMNAAAGDPTRPPFVEMPPSQQVVSEPLQLSMILQERGRHRAVINGKSLAVADWISNAKVVAINQDHVLMARGGRQFKLQLPIGAVKTVSKGGMHEQDI